MKILNKKIVVLVISIFVVATVATWFVISRGVFNEQKLIDNSNAINNVNVGIDNTIPSKGVNNNNTNSTTINNASTIEIATDATAPEVANIEVKNITRVSATITWTTNENSSSLVEYGTTQNYEIDKQFEPSLIQNHVISLTNLEENTTYHFRVKSQDHTGNEAASEDFFFSTYKQYSLKALDNIGALYGNPVGITTDQKNLWLMFGAYNAMEHKLVYYNPDSNEIIKSFDFHNLIEALGTGVYGITWDGASIWISVSGNTNKLVQVDPNSGEILKTWSSPVTLGPSDLAWDGSSIWVSSGTGQIYFINPSNGSSSTFLKKLPRDNGIAIQGDEVWVGNLFNGNVNIYNKKTNTLIQSMKKAFLQNGNFCFFKGKVAVVNSAGIQFYSIEQSS